MKVRKIVSFLAVGCAVLACGALFGFALLTPQEPRDREIREREEWEQRQKEYRQSDEYRQMVSASLAEAYEKRLAAGEEPDKAIEPVRHRVKSQDGRWLAEYGYQAYIYASRRSSDGMWDYAFPQLTIQKDGGKERSLVNGRDVVGVADGEFDQCVAVGFSPDSQYLVAGFGTRGEPSTNVSGNGLLTIWRLVDSALVYHESFEYSEPEHFVFSRDGSRLHVGMADYQATVSVRQMPTGKELWRASLGRYDRSVEKMTLTPRGGPLKLVGRTTNLGEAEDWPWQATLSLTTRRFTVLEQPKLN